MQQLEQLETADKRRILEQLNRTMSEAGDDEAAAVDMPRGAEAAQGATSKIVVEVPARPPPRRLRLFSGKLPVPSGEVDFESWKVAVEQMLADQTMTEEIKKLTMLESLLRPALDVIRSISVSTDAAGCLTMLRNMYGQVQDGHDLLVDFLVTYQEGKETASEYVNRLYIKLISVAEKGGIAVGEVSTYLLRQFIRGCQDDTMVQKLHLEEKEDNPPEFGNLLLSIRKEESRRTAKRLQQKQTAAINKAQNVAGKDTASNYTKELEARVQQLSSEVEQIKRSQVATDRSPAPSQQAPRGTTRPPHTKQQSHRSRGTFRHRSSRRTSFCFKCGTDGHKMETCQKAANAELVQQKLMGHGTKSQDLNSRQHLSWDQ